MLFEFGRRFFYRGGRIVVIGLRLGKVHTGGDAALYGQPLQPKGRVLFNRAGVRLLLGNAHFGQEL